MNTTAPVNELRYLMAHNFLVLLLEQEKISPKEFSVADQFVVKKYQPKLLVL